MPGGAAQLYVVRRSDWPTSGVETPRLRNRFVHRRRVTAEVNSAVGMRCDAHYGHDWPKTGSYDWTR